jgi:hypothetical protein
MTEETNTQQSNGPATPQQGNEPTVSEQAQTLLRDPFSSFTEDAVNAMQRVSELAERGPVIVLLTLGPAMIILALAFKLQVLGQGISSLSSSEFITVILTGSLLVILGGLIRLYQYRLSQELRKGIQATAERALEATVENSNKIIESELQLRQSIVAKQIEDGKAPEPPPL